MWKMFNSISCERKMAFLTLRRHASTAPFARISSAEKGFVASCEGGRRRERGKRRQKEREEGRRVKKEKKNDEFI
jgi:hypothetical protein